MEKGRTGRVCPSDATWCVFVLSSRSSRFDHLLSSTKFASPPSFYSHLLFSFSSFFVFFSFFFFFVFRPVRCSSFVRPYVSWSFAKSVGSEFKSRRSRVAVVRDDACGRVAAIRLWEHPGCFSVTRENYRLMLDNVLVRTSVDLSRSWRRLSRVDLNLLSSFFVLIYNLKNTQLGHTSSSVYTGRVLIIKIKHFECSMIYTRKVFNYSQVSYCFCHCKLNE